MQNKTGLEACQDFSLKKIVITNSDVEIYVILTNGVFHLCSSLAMKSLPEPPTLLLTALAHQGSYLLQPAVLRS